jgi:hypothetical protein
MLRGPPSAVRRPRSAVRGPPSAVRRPRSAVRGPPSAVRGPPSAVRRPRSAVRGPSAFYTLLRKSEMRFTLSVYFSAKMLIISPFDVTSIL